MKNEIRKIRKFNSLFLSAFLLFALAPYVYAADTPLAIGTGGRYTLENGKSYNITTSGTVYNCNINVPSGRTASLTVNGNLTIHNASYRISPITVASGARLMLFVNGSLTVYGGNATSGADVSATVGQKGCAGISLPVNAILKVGGQGTLTAIGGNAGAGGKSVSLNRELGASGGGGAGAGIGGDGGNGGAAIRAQLGGNGSSGTSSGIICVMDTVQVYAMGGSGGAGGSSNTSSGADGGGGGGYPAAGIGGGGGGGGAGDAGGGAGGYNGGPGQGTTAVAYNGTGGASGIRSGGGGYFSVGSVSSYAGCAAGAIGGGGGKLNSSYSGGNGGVGGAGANVTVASSARVTAYNGNYNSSSPANASYQTPIYAQLGYDLNRIRSAGIKTVSGRTASAVTSNLSSVARTITTPALGLGFGSGAGYTESGNGTYLNENSRSGSPIVEIDGLKGLLIYGWTAPSYNGNLSLTRYQVDVYADAECKTFVQSVQTSNSVIPGANAPLKVTGLTPGETYYVTVSAWFGSALGLPSAVSEGRLPNVIASPENGSYYKLVTCELEGVNTAGYEVMYAVDGGAWKLYPKSGIVLNTNTSVQYGLRKTGAANVQQVGTRAYTIFDVSAAPESGAYYQKVDMNLTTDPAGANIAATGHELVYSTDNGASWTAYPAAGVRFTSSVAVRYGVRRNGEVTEAGSREYNVFDVSCSPESGSYYKKVDVVLTGAGVKESGGTLVYSVDNGNKWSVYPASGLTLTQSTIMAYGIRMGDGTVLKVGERTYVISPHAVTFTSLTLHNSANGTGAVLSMADISGLTGQITAKLSGVVSYTSDAGYIVLAVYGENGKMERMTLTPIGGRSGDVVSKAVQLSGGMTSAYAVRAFVIESFADMAPVGKVVGIGKENKVY